MFNYSYSGQTQDVITKCTEDISLLNAADCLYYRYHEREWIRYIWSIGLLAAGQSSTMTVSATYMHVGNVFRYFYMPWLIVHAVFSVEFQEGRGAISITS